MSETAADDPLYADARRTALEVIATLVNVKRLAADHLLRAAGAPQPLINRFISGRDATTNEPMTKRQGGALILEELARDGRDGVFVRKLLDIAANWNSFHLAADEYKARAVVQKARELTGSLAESDARERARQEKERSDRTARERRERESTLRKASALLLAQFDHAAVDGSDPQARGYLLQDLLNRTFDLHGIPPAKAFLRNDGGEQIDAAFELDGWHYIVECRWRKKLADIRELDGLLGQIGRSGRQTMGLYLSINGWSEHVIPLIKQNHDKSIILMEGFDLRMVLAQPFDLRTLLKAKIRALNLEAEPYLSIAKIMKADFQIHTP
jgi:hypothetical protein